MAVDDLAEADPLPRMLSWLGSHAAVSKELGGVGRVDALNKPPYPRIRVTHSSGSDGDLRWLIAPEFRLEALDDLDGSTGRSRLRRALYIAVGALVELSEMEPPPGEPVITNVSSAQGGGWIPLPTGQGRYVAVVQVHAHRGT
jgi:hypothetical protein